jgi:arsenate reductase (thioredoxin)
MPGRPKVLFLSAGNSTRSQMSEGLLRQLAGDRFIVSNAATEPNGINSVAVEVMAEAGIDISKQQPKKISESLKDHFAYVITLYDAAKEVSPVFPFTTNLVSWNLTDPERAESHEHAEEAFRQLRDEITIKIREFLEDVAREQQGQDRTVIALQTPKSDSP